MCFWNASGSLAEPVITTRNKPRLKAVEKRFKDPSDSLKIVIVRDMWLTGFGGSA